MRTVLLADPKTRLAAHWSTNSPTGLAERMEFRDLSSSSVGTMPDAAHEESPASASTATPVCVGGSGRYHVYIEQSSVDRSATDRQSWGHSSAVVSGWAGIPVSWSRRATSSWLTA